MHFLPDPRNQGGYLVRNPYVIPPNETAGPIYEQESPEVYKELYYRSLVQLQLPTKYGPSERDALAPEFYLQVSLFELAVFLISSCIIALLCSWWNRPSSRSKVYKQQQWISLSRALIG